MLITRKSIISDIERTRDIDVTQEQLDRLAAGNELPAKVLSNLSPADRDFIISGIVDQEWEDTLPDA